MLLAQQSMSQQQSTRNVIGGPSSQTVVPGLIGKETMTFRGQLESLESVLNDIVSELKYHRRQVEIIGAEKETSGAVLQMNIVKAKN